MSGRERLSRQPLSAPVWLWLAYVVLIGTLAVVAEAAWVCVVFAAAFSFQFWCFAAWRGAALAADADSEPLSADLSPEPAQDAPDDPRAPGGRTEPAVGRGGGA